MKKLFVLLLAAATLLALWACAAPAPVPSQSEPAPTETEAPPVELTAQELAQALREALGDSYRCDQTDDEAMTAGYYHLNMEHIDSLWSESMTVSAVNLDQAVILRVKEGYAQEALEGLQAGFHQKAGYAYQYGMDLLRLGQTRLFCTDNYVALLLLGRPTDPEADPDAQALQAEEEGKKVDAAWAGIFGQEPRNLIEIPKPGDFETGGMGGIRPRE